MIATEEGISISEFLTRKLREIVRDRKSYARARKRALHASESSRSWLASPGIP